MGYSRNRNTSQKRKIARLNIADQNDKIEACERLSRDYNVSKVELLLQYDKFKRDNENGVITKERFLSEEKVLNILLPQIILLFLQAIILFKIE